MVQDKSTPLHWAAYNGNSESVQLLLAADSDPNAETDVSAAPSKYDGVVWC